MKPIHGRFTNRAWAQRMIEDGLGLSEAAIDAFHQRVEHARLLRRPQPSGEVGEFRRLLENAYRSRI